MPVLESLTYASLGASGDTFSWTHTISPGANPDERLLVVIVAFNNTATSFISDLTIDGVSLNEVGYVVTPSVGSPRYSLHFYRRKNASGIISTLLPGNRTITVTSPGMVAGQVNAISAVYKDAAQLGPRKTRADLLNSGNTVDPGADTGSGREIVIQGGIVGATGRTWTPDVTQNQRHAQDVGTSHGIYLGDGAYGSALDPRSAPLSVDGAATPLAGFSASFLDVNYGGPGIYSFEVETSVVPMLYSFGIETSVPPMLLSFEVETGLPPAVVTGQWGYSGTVDATLSKATVYTETVSGRWGYDGRARSVEPPFVVVRSDYYIGSIYCRPGAGKTTDIAALRAQGFRVELVDDYAGHTWVTVSGALAATIEARESSTWHSRPAYFFGPVPVGTILTESYLRQWAPRSRVMGIW